MGDSRKSVFELNSMFGLSDDEDLELIIVDVVRDNKGRVKSIIVKQKPNGAQ